MLLVVGCSPDNSVSVLDTDNGEVYETKEFVGYTEYGGSIVVPRDFACRSRDIACRTAVWRLGYNGSLEPESEHVLYVNGKEYRVDGHCVLRKYFTQGGVFNMEFTLKGELVGVLSVSLLTSEVLCDCGLDKYMSICMSSFDGFCDRSVVV